MLNHIDLFSGIGGFSLAARWAGFNTVQFVEIDPFCQKVLRKNFHEVPIHADIKTFNYDKPVTLLTGGFPCQPFSISGKKKGIADERYLWPDMFRIIKQCKPSWIIAENVTNLLKMGINELLSDLGRENYESLVLVLPACSANAPHRRDRLWIIAYLNSERFDSGEHNGKKRSLQNNKKWDVKALQSEWAQLKPESWSTYKAKDWFLYNAEISRGNDGISERLDKSRVKSLGNSIVPQVVYPILKFISLIEQQKDISYD